MSFEVPDPVAAAFQPSAEAPAPAVPRSPEHTLAIGLAALLALCLVASAIGYYEVTHRKPVAPGVTLTIRVPAGCDLQPATSNTLVITVRTAADGTAITGCRLERPALMWKVPA